MPTYDYVCRGCGHRFERFQKISEAPVRECPKCGEPEADRLISAGAGVVFKGSGFYATDYRKTPPPDEKHADRGADVSSEGNKDPGSGSSERSDKKDKKEE